MQEFIINRCVNIICDMDEDALIELRKIIDDRIAWINGDEPNE
jgi:hypothetical protein|tara:strand:+ start:914 stop:1042 length:129 start_codon:yes stop_codon:yes gene_type:complete